MKALVKFGRELAERYLNKDDPREEAMINAAVHFDRMYFGLSTRAIFWEDTLRENCRKLCLFCVALLGIHAIRRPFGELPKHATYLLQRGAFKRVFVHETTRWVTYGALRLWSNFAS